MELHPSPGRAHGVEQEVAVRSRDDAGRITDHLDVARRMAAQPPHGATSATRGSAILAVDEARPASWLAQRCDRAPPWARRGASSTSLAAVGARRAAPPARHRARCRVDRPALGSAARKRISPAAPPRPWCSSPAAGDQPAPTPVPIETNATRRRRVPRPASAPPSAARLYVVVHRDRDAEPRRQLRREVDALELLHRRSTEAGAALRRDRRREPRRRSSRSAPAGVGGRDERVAQLDEGVERAGRALPRTSTSCRARTTPCRSHSAPRRKRAPRSRPSTSAASATGSKKTAP